MGECVDRLVPCVEVSDAVSVRCSVMLLGEVIGAVVFVVDDDV